MTHSDSINRSPFANVTGQWTSSPQSCLIMQTKRLNSLEFLCTTWQSGSYWELLLYIGFERFPFGCLTCWKHFNEGVCFWSCTRRPFVHGHVICDVCAIVLFCVKLDASVFILKSVYCILSGNTERYRL